MSYFYELVHEYIPEATEAECLFILWDLTEYPYSSMEETKKKLQYIKGVGAGNAMPRNMIRSLRIKNDKSNL